MELDVSVGEVRGKYRHTVGQAENMQSTWAWNFLKFCVGNRGLVPLSHPRVQLENYQGLGIGFHMRDTRYIRKAFNDGDATSGAY